MRLRDVLQPERVIAYTFQCFLWLVALLLAGELFANFVAMRHAPIWDIVVFLVIAAMTSPVAYLARERRRKRPGRKVLRRGAERTPVLPQDRGEA